MSRFLLPFVFCAFAAVASAKPLPLTANDIGLMLRTGYSNKDILQELNKRRFADTLDSAKQSKLIQAGASPELLFALTSGSYAVSAEEAEQVQQLRELEAKRRAAAVAEDSRKSSFLQAQRPADRGVPSTNGHAIYEQVKNDLVQFRNGGVSHFDDGQLENKKFFLIYFSAHWCGPCRKFTPDLVNYYNETIAKHPEIEVIFVSRDKSAFGMETYMRELNMPWPAIEFPKVAQKDGIEKYAGKGIPDLVLVDSGGKVVADSYRGEQYLGPESVLQALNGILTNGSANQVAQAR